MEAIFTHPHIYSLREQRKSLVQRLYDVVTELQTLKDRILPELLAEYDRNFRELEIALQKQTLETAEMTRREELFRIKLGRGEKLNEEMIRAVNSIVDREYERVKKRFRESFEMSRTDREEAALRKTERLSDSEFAALYRSIVKKLHPDAQDPSLKNLSPESITKSNAAEYQETSSAQAQQHFEQFWQSAQEAYKNRNIRELRAIHDIVCQEAREDFSAADSSIESLQQEIVRLESRLRNEERRLREIVQNPPYTQRELMKSRTWVESEQNALKAKIAEKERDFERSKAFLASLHALDNSWKNAEKSSNDDAQEVFTNDFMENTYFNNR